MRAKVLAMRSRAHHRKLVQTVEMIELLCVMLRGYFADCAGLPRSFLRHYKQHCARHHCEHENDFDIGQDDDDEDELEEEEESDVLSSLLFDKPRMSAGIMAKLLRENLQTTTEPMPAAAATAASTAAANAGSTKAAAASTAFERGPRVATPSAYITSAKSVPPATMARVKKIMSPPLLKSGTLKRKPRSTAPLPADQDESESRLPPRSFQEGAITKGEVETVLSTFKKKRRQTKTNKPLPNPPELHDENARDMPILEES